MKKSEFIRKSGNLLGILVLKALLELAYIYCVAPTWTNLQFEYTPNWTSCLLSYIYCIIIVLVIADKEETLPSLICYFFVITSVVPYMIIYWTNNKSHWYAFWAFCMVILICLLANKRGTGWVIREGANRGILSLIIYCIFLAYCVIGLWLCVKGGGIDLRALSFTDAYAIRAEGTGLNTIEGYLLSWSAKVLTPFFMAYFLYYKEYFKCGICMLIQILFYFTFGHKAYLLSVGLFWVLFLISKLFKKVKQTYCLFFGALAISAVLYGIGVQFKVFWLVAWQGIMRMFMEPAKIKFQYYEFFEERSKLFFSEGIIGRLFSIEYPFDKAIGYIISDYFSDGKLISNSNTGVIGDAYAQMGIMGMIVCGVICGVLVLLTVKVSTQIPTAYSMAMFGYMCMTLNDNPLQTTVLTGGWLVLIVMMLLFNSEIYNRKKLIKKREQLGVLSC